MRIILAFALVLCTLIELQAQEKSTFTAHFSTNSAILDSADKSQLSKLCEDLKNAEPTSISITGYADIRGNASFNNNLGLRRARALTEALLEVCDYAGQVRLQSSGETQAIHDVTSSVNHMRDDRRAELTFEIISPLPSGTSATDSKKQEAHTNTSADNECSTISFETAPALQFITPLIPSIDKPSQVFTVNASEPILLYCADGAVLKIPANAILDSKGNVVTEPVNIHYRSFSESYEIIASGIPMHIETPSATGHFETAGMYEVLATLNGELLQLKEDENISITQRKEKAVGDDYGTFVINPSSGAWQTGGALNDTTITSQGIAIPIFLDEYNNRMWKTPEPDSALFNARRSSNEFAYLTKAQPKERKKFRLKKKENPYYGIRRIPNISLSPSSRSVWRKNARVSFIMSVPKGYYPEFRRFPQSMIWTLNEQIDHASFKEQFMKNHWYQDIMLDMDPSTFEGTLMLKEKGNWLSLKVSIANQVNNENEEYWSRAIAQYDKELERKRSRFDKRTTSAHERWKNKEARNFAIAYNKAKSSMTDEQLAWSASQFRDSANAYLAALPVINWGNRVDYTEEMNESFKFIQQEFKLEGFGVYNIDRIMKMSERQQIIANVNCDGEQFDWNMAYGVLKGRRAVITFWGNGGSECGMLVARGKMEALFFVNQDGSIAKADVSPLNNMHPSALKVGLSCTALNDPQSVEDMKFIASTD